ncbi:PREDICTED: uncharacterized protein LOC104773024 isoform X2 [Camelina sativa]|uniref:Uncharacterized protein LOC104773024 isoform X2 n=1 Tax=Camelina sativa TaxID=90675 RepID=A0ABM1RGH6_CAMSA|nr:PREDICTED: uncharacterized protein LOC104773024 isoform X2 [Camelina sativa]
MDYEAYRSGKNRSTQSLSHGDEYFFVCHTTSSKSVCSFFLHRYIEEKIKVMLRKKLFGLLTLSQKDLQGRIFGLGKVAKRLCACLSSSSPIYDRDPELVRALQEKDDRIEALEKMIEKENERNKLRDEELASFMAEMRSKFPVNSSS